MTFHVESRVRTCCQPIDRGSDIKTPAGTTKNGKIKAISRVSGSNTPLFFLARHSTNLSVRPPPQYAPTRMPMFAGTLMRLFIPADIEYGGLWNTVELVSRTQIIQ